MKKVTLKNEEKGVAIRVPESEVTTYLLQGYKLTAKKVLKRFFKMENKLARNFRYLANKGISRTDGKLNKRPQDLLKVTGDTTYYLEKTTDFVNRIGIEEALNAIPFLEREAAAKEITAKGKHSDIFFKNVFPQFTRRILQYKL